MCLSGFEVCICHVERPKLEAVSIRAVHLFLCHLSTRRSLPNEGGWPSNCYQ